MTTSQKLVEWLKRSFNLTLGPLLVLLVVIGAGVLAACGMKLQVGGIIAMLLGKKRPDDHALDVANSVAKERVDAAGKLIPQGVADERGMTQAVVVPVKSPGLLSDPRTVSFTPPGEERAREVALPVGVTSKQVENVVVVNPGQFVVTVKDDAGVSAQDVDDLLKKYS